MNSSFYFVHCIICVSICETCLYYLKANVNNINFDQWIYISRHLRINKNFTVFIRHDFAFASTEFTIEAIKSNNCCTVFSFRFFPCSLFSFRLVAHIGSHIILQISRCTYYSNLLIHHLNVEQSNDVNGRHRFQDTKRINNIDGEWKHIEYMYRKRKVQ